MNKKQTRTESGKMIIYNRRGDALVQVSAQIPVKVYEAFSEDTIVQGLDETKMLIKILKKYYDFK